MPKKRTDTRVYKRGVRFYGDFRELIHQSGIIGEYLKKLFKLLLCFIDPPHLQPQLGQVVTERRLLTVRHRR